jgi:hypothetical protein
MCPVSTYITWVVLVYLAQGHVIFLPSHRAQLLFTLIEIPVEFWNIQRHLWAEMMTLRNSLTRLFTFGSGDSSCFVP